MRSYLIVSVSVHYIYLADFVGLPCSQVPTMSDLRYCNIQMRREVQKDVASLQMRTEGLIAVCDSRCTTDSCACFSPGEQVSRQELKGPYLSS